MGRRILAYIIDGILATAVMVAVFAGVASSEDRSSALEAEAICDILNNDIGETYACINIDNTVVLADGGDMAIVALAWLVFMVANFLILPTLTGFSLGKAVVGLRVVNADTFEKGGFVAHLVRLLLWAVDSAPWCFPLVGLITGLSSNGHRRVGDMAASTLVIDKKWVGQPLPVAGANNVAHTVGAPSSFGTPAPPAMGITPPPPGSTIGSAPPPPPGMGVPAASPPPPPGAGIIAPPASSPPPPNPGLDTPPASTPPPSGAPVFPAPPSSDGAPPPPPITEPDPPVEPDMDATTAVEAVSPTGDRTTDETTMIAPIALPPDDEQAPDDESAPDDADEPMGEPAAAWATDIPTPEVTPPPPPAAPEPEPEPEPEAPAGVGAPQWDAARDTYIQWDPELNEWMEWSESAGAWVPISR